MEGFYLFSIAFIKTLINSEKKEKKVPRSAVCENIPVLLWLTNREQNRIGEEAGPIIESHPRWAIQRSRDGNRDAHKFKTPQKRAEIEFLSSVLSTQPFRKENSSRIVQGRSHWDFCINYSALFPPYGCAHSLEENVLMKASMTRRFHGQIAVVVLTRWMFSLA